MSDDIEILIDDAGDVQFIYSDDAAELFAGVGAATTVRASHVEPHPLGHGWIADMGPVGGPYLTAAGEYCVVDGARWNTVAGFPTRAAALAAEVAWLRAAMARGPVAPGEPRDA